MRKYIFWGIILFIISLMVGYFYGQRIFEGTALVENSIIKSNNINTNSIIENTVVQTSAREIKILPSTNLALKKIYKDCNHVSFEFVDLPNELINKNKEEVEELYGDWNVEQFVENKVVLSKEVEGICEEHFLLTLGEKFIEIYKFTDENNKVLYSTTDISKEYLTEQDILKLENGVRVYGKDKLNSAIEDFE